VHESVIKTYAVFSDLTLLFLWQKQQVAYLSTQCHIPQDNDLQVRVRTPNLKRTAHEQKTKMSEMQHPKTYTKSRTTTK